MKFEFLKNILSLHRYAKRTIIIIVDIIFCVICTWLAFCLRLDEIIAFRNLNIQPIIISILIAIPIFWLFGLYKTIYRNSGLSIIFSIISSTILYGLTYFIIIGVYGINGVPRSVGIIQPMILFFSVLSSRLMVKYIFLL